MDSKARPLAEEAIRALGRLDAGAARTAIAQAFDADPKIGRLADAVHLACAEIDDEGAVTPPTWDTLADAVDSPALVAEVEANRN